MEAAGATWIWCPEQVPMASGKELCREECSKGPVQQRAAYVRQGWGGQGCSRDSPIPILGCAPWCHGTDRATRPGAAALQDGQTVAPQDGAEGGGTACCSQGTQKWAPCPCSCPTEHTPTAPQHCLFPIQLLLTCVPCPWQGVGLCEP